MLSTEKSVMFWGISRATEREGQKFLFIASLDEFKEPPNRSSLQRSKSAFRFSSLAPCPFCSLRSQTQGASFCSFAPGPQKPLGGPGYMVSLNTDKDKKEYP